MARIFWSGKLSLPMALLVNANSVLAWLGRSSRRNAEMTRRVKQGYEGDFSDHVRSYDDLGWTLQARAAKAQLEDFSVAGKTVLDVGCGSGALSFLALERGAASVTCGDISLLMLGMAEKKAAELGPNAGRISFRELDAQALPYPEASFDAVLTGMTLGLVPDQKRAVSEMVRVCRPGGTVCVGAHGPEHYWEAVDGCFRAIPKRYVLGYRIEYWPQSERHLRRMMVECGLRNLRFKRVIWRNVFPSGAEALDFFASISASFWYGKLPPAKVASVAERTRRYFDSKNIVQITDDVIFGYGFKPG